MQIKVLKDFNWSHNGRIVNYKGGQVAEVTKADGESMIKHAYAEVFVQKEAKMFKHDVVEDKMMHLEVDNKSMDRVAGRRFRKSKEVENE